jgi:hypothetical protein
MKEGIVANNMANTNVLNKSICDMKRYKIHLCTMINSALDVKPP